jgi:hypothetical protein
MQIPKMIRGTTAFLAEFGGEWPNFHDAEVLRFAVERAAVVEVGEVVVCLVVHLRRFETHGVGTVNYHLALVKSVVVDFRFTGVEDLSVSDFNHQNVLEEIAFSESDGGAPVSVEVSSIYGFEGGWLCRSACVLRCNASARRSSQTLAI